jgi:diadenosine tetraphosphate (Ap4A) HIT family hydrolase
MTVCSFCSMAPENILSEDELTFTVRDSLPVSPGHTLILPKRHIASVFEATRAEIAALWGALEKARRDLTTADGFNIGINDGLAAGQTILHLHVHLIPRYTGDMPDPRGGIRWIFPDKAVYWKN